MSVRVNSASIHARMLAIERGSDRPDENIPVGEMIAQMLGVEHHKHFDVLLAAETDRVRELVNTYYAQFAIGSPASTYAMVGFLQGVTFALAVQQVKAIRREVPRRESRGAGVMSDRLIPDDFGGFVGAWVGTERAVIMRTGKGQPQEAMSFTPLNLLQARLLINSLIGQGEEMGYITAEHRAQSDQLPSTPLADAPPRADVDRIAGDQ